MPIYSFNGIRWDQLSKYIEIPINGITNFGGIETPTSGLIPYYELTKASYFSTPSSSISSSAPTNIQSGDLLLLYCHADNSNNSSQIFTLPSGWTSSFSDFSGTVGVETTLFYKISDGTEGNLNIGLNNAITFIDVAIWYIKISGIDQTNPITTGSLSQATTPASFITASSLITPANNCLVFAGVTFDGGDGEPFTPSGTGWPTSIPPGQETEVGSGGGNLSCGWITKTVSIAGSSSDVVFTIINPGLADTMQARQFAIRPAP
jgi:hypothetical protein